MPFASEARGLTKFFPPDRAAVDGIDFEIDERACFGFLGPNGAGKTTTMRMLFGRLHRTAGDLHVLGLDPDRQTREVRSRIGVVTQENNLDQDLTVLENLLVHAGYFGLGGPELRRRAADLLSFMELEGRERAHVRELSGGMQRRLLVARGLINRPELLILDEPTTGLDPQARLVVWQRLGELREQGVTIVLTTHYMEEAARLCDCLVVMHAGRIVERGTPRELIRRHAGDQVLELRWPAAAEQPALGRAPVRRVDRHGDRLLVFTDDPAAALAALAGRASPEAMVIRPATLEDVFIHLTGRELQE
ncbi:MAG TPA: ABC transporter ATP-binding protein [Candidatus Dormibacteraeota bacterium]